MRRSNKLNNELVLVSGGASTIGEGIVRSILHQGAHVLVPSKNHHGLIELKTKFARDIESSRLFTIHEDITKERGIENIKKEIKRIEDDERVSFMHVLSAKGVWWDKGAVTKISIEEFNSALTDLVGKNFVVLHHFYPMIRHVVGATYTFVTGGAAQQVPSIDAGMVTIGSAANQALAKVVMEEAKEDFCRVNEYRIMKRVRPYEEIGEEIITNIDVGEDYVKNLILETHDRKTFILQ